MSTIWNFPITHQLITGSLVEFMSCIRILSRLQLRLVYICPFIKELPLQLVIFSIFSFIDSWLTGNCRQTYTRSYCLNLAYDFIFQPECWINAVFLNKQQSIF